MRSWRRPVSPVAGSLVARIGKDDCLLAMQKAVHLGNFVEVGGRADDRVHQYQVCLHPNVRLHAKVPLIPLLTLAHLKVALANAVHGGAERCNQCGIYFGTGFEYQALAGQGGVSRVQPLQAQLALFKQVMPASGLANSQYSVISCRTSSMAGSDRPIQYFME